MARRANGEGSITTAIRNGKTYYKATITVGKDYKGNYIRKSFGSFKKSVVIEKMRETKYEFEHNMSIDSDMTLDSLFFKWIFDYKKIEVSDNTFAEYEVMYRLRIKPYQISNKKIAQITLDDLQMYFNSLQDDWTINTIKKTYTKINACFNFALLQGIIIKNLCLGVKLPKKIEQEKENVFSKKEQEMLLNSLDLRSITDFVIFFTLYTGLRIGEVLAVKWSDIENNILKVKEQYQKKVEIDRFGVRRTTYVFKELKTKGSKREIPLPAKLVSALEELDKTYDLIFNTDGKPLEPKRVPRRLKQLCKKLNIPHRSFHSLRHSYATRLFEIGVPAKTIQTLLGHSEIATTLDIYTHVMREKKIEVIDMLNLI